MKSVNNSFTSLYRSLAVLLPYAALLCLCAPALTAEAENFEEIIVVAEKRQQSLQALPQAVSALSAGDLEQRHILSFVDLANMAPGITVSKNEGFKTIIAIRGIGNEANQNPLTNPSVSYHLDGVYVASPFAIQTDFIDLERIEVLRGPQGTLFGQNSTAGAINVITAAPTTDRVYGKADFAYGEYDAIRSRATVNLPLGERAAMRTSLAYYAHDGFSDNLVLGQDLDDANNLSARLRLLLQPVNELTLNFSAQYFNEDSHGAAQKNLLDSTAGARRLRQDSPAEYALESQLYSLVAEWQLAAFTLKSLSSYQYDEILIRRDNDRSDLNSLPPFSLLPAFYDPEINKIETHTQELNLISSEPLFGRLDWILGLFYLHTEVDTHIRERIDYGFDGRFDAFSTADVFAFNGDFGFLTDSLTRRKSLSAFAQGSYQLSAATRLTGGLRYTHDRISGAFNNFLGRSGTDNIRRSTQAYTGRVALEHNIDDDTLTYAAWTRGFKPGGVNLTFGRESNIAPILVLPLFEDEEINAFEIGLKTDWFGGRVRSNFAAFYYQYDNMQFQATDPEVFEGGVGNIPQAKSYGLELELLAALRANLHMDLKLSLLETKITSSFLALDNVRSDAVTNALLIPVCGGNLFCDDIQRARSEAILDVKGNKLAKAPAITADLSFQYQRPLFHYGELSASLQLSYRGKFRQRIFSNPRTDHVPAFTTVNTVWSFDAASERWGMDLLAMNIFDKDGINARFTDVFGVGSTSDELIPPRQIMARMRVYF